MDDDRFDALGDPRLRAVALHVRAQASPVTADDVASALSIPRTVARSRLERLADARLLTIGFERRNGRTGPGAGRPAKTYAAAAETSAIEFPRRHYETLVRLLLEGGDLVSIGYAFGAELARAARVGRARTVRAALGRVCAALGRLGFQASVESVTAEEAVIVSATCPLRPLVVAGPRTRAIDEGMWRGLLAAAAGEEAVAGLSCRTSDCLDDSLPCRIVVARRG
jgi:predicted ArsR family transcriptional regulator